MKGPVVVIPNTGSSDPASMTFLKFPRHDIVVVDPGIRPAIEFEGYEIKALTQPSSVANAPGAK
jgi:hypothetical protein